MITVQKYFRRMLAKCTADQLRLRLRCQQERDQQRLAMKEVDSERRLQRDFKRRLNPRTKDDFELLYNAMEGPHDSDWFRNLHDALLIDISLLEIGTYMNANALEQNFSIRNITSVMIKVVVEVVFFYVIYAVFFIFFTERSSNVRANFL